MNWMKQVIGFATFAFIFMILFIVLSRPYTMIVDMVQNESDTHLDEETVNHSITPFLGTLRTLFGLMFVLSFFGLILALFLVSHRDEYEEYPEEYRRL